MIKQEPVGPVPCARGRHLETATAVVGTLLGRSPHLGPARPGRRVISRGKNGIRIYSGIWCYIPVDVCIYRYMVLGCPGRGSLLVRAEHGAIFAAVNDPRSLACSCRVRNRDD